MLDLLSAHAVRTRCAEATRLVREGNSPHFFIDDQAIDVCACYVVEECRTNYPSLEIPIHSRWRHFVVHDVDFWSRYSRRYQLNKLSVEEYAKTAIDLVFISVLLDAGAGSKWQYVDAETGMVLTRSEGLAAASIKFFENIAEKIEDGIGISADRLLQLSAKDLESCFQVGPENPLVGVEGRIALLRNLGIALQNSKRLKRPGDLLSVMSDRSNNGTIDAADLLHQILIEFNSIWPSGLLFNGQNLGDAAVYHQLPGTDDSDKIVPFHKLSQWLCYSLIEPFTWAGLKVVNQNALTALPEYRNGGLLLDTGVIRPKNPDLFSKPHALRSEAVVEWRAMTVSLIDVVANYVRINLGQSSNQLPLGSILQGGTWSAGRKIARHFRPDSSPPLKLEIDGTIF